MDLKESEILYIVVGQKGNGVYAGSGGTFVAKKVNQTFIPVIIAGGAGGANDWFGSKVAEECSARTECVKVPDNTCRLRKLRDGTGFYKIFLTDRNHIGNTIPVRA